MDSFSGLHMHTSMDKKVKVQHKFSWLAETKWKKNI